MFVVAGVLGEGSMATEGRRGRWLPLVYYYLATVVGLALLLTGLIGGLRGLVVAAIPQASHEFGFAEFGPTFGPEGERIELSKEERAEQRERALERARLGGFADALQGLVTAVVAAPVFFWHLRQARRKEPEWFGPAASEGQ